MVDTPLGILGIEEVVQNGISSYYSIEWHSNTIITFDDKFKVKRRVKGEFDLMDSLKYVENSFYIIAPSVFYKTNLHFRRIDQFKDPYFRPLRFDYDIINSKFYIIILSNYLRNYIKVFDKSCSFLYEFGMANNFSPIVIAVYNNNLYIAPHSQNQMIAITSNTGQVIEYFNKNINDPCRRYGFSINVDSLGYVAIGCRDPAIIVLYDSKGNYVTKTKLTFNEPIREIKIMSNNRLAIVDESSVFIFN